MSQNSSLLSSGVGATIGLSKIIGAIYAFASTPQFVGWAGAGKSAFVGIGTGFGGTLCMLGGGVAGAAGGYALGAVVDVVTGGRTEMRTLGAVAGSVLVGLGGLVYGIPQGYEISHGWLANSNEVCAPVAKEDAALKIQGPTQTATFSGGQLKIAAP